MIHKVILHIGLHKTGTTSFQKFLLDNEAFFNQNNIELYKPIYRDNSRTSNEIGFAVLRSGIIDQLIQAPWNVDVRGAKPAEWYDAIQRHLVDICTCSPRNTLLISAEYLSLIRSLPEIKKLRMIFPSFIQEFHVVLVLRNKISWWKSYKEEVLKWRDQIDGPVGPGTNEHAYLIKNWLTDFKTLSAVYKKSFQNVTTLKYSKNIIPPLLAAMNLSIPQNQTFFLNQRKKNSKNPLSNIYFKHLAQTFVGRAWRRLKRKSHS